MSKHTPGKWKIGIATVGGFWIKDANGIDVVSCDGDTFRYGSISNEANANLIAAAPDLLEALKELRKRLIKCSADPISAAEAYDSFYQDIVLSAINKAEGKV